MIGLLDQSLRRVSDSCGADVAVIWGRVGESSAGTVICTHPVDLLPSAMAWPAVGGTASGVIHRDAAAVAALVPTSVSLELPAAATAALSMELADQQLVLLLIWCGSPVGAELPAETRRLIAGETADLARVADLLTNYGRTSLRLQAVVDDLSQGVVSVDHARNQITSNPAAVGLLNLPAGTVGPAEFAAAMALLEGRALNRAQVVSMGQQLLADPWTDLDCTWLFAENPTHLHVRSRVVRKGVLSERIWVFDDVSGPAQTLAASDAARDLLQATVDSMLDPQVLLQAVRDRTGSVVDFRYLSVNWAACTYLGVDQSDLVGHTQLEASPNLEGSDLHRRFTRCVEVGEPVILDDFAFFNEILDDGRRYDVRANRAGVDLLSLTWSDVTERFDTAQRVLDAQALLRATVDSMLNSQVLLEAVRDPGGRVVDFVYRSANRTACSYLGIAESDLLGSRQLDTMPNLEASGLTARYAQCLDTGEPVVLDDFSFFNNIFEDERRYDIRATRAGTDLISLTWSDVTERFQTAERIAASEQDYRLLAENASDVIVHGRDGRVAWISPSVVDVLGGTPDYWIGRPLIEVTAVEQQEKFAARMQALAEGRSVQERTRWVALDGTTHWMHVHSKPFYDDDGNQDGFTASLRLIDDEVAAEGELEEARMAQAKADERYRRSMDNAAVGMCLTAPDGRFEEVNDALCHYFGYDAENLQQMGWQELTAPEYLEADQINVEKMISGQIESYRLTKQFIHAAGQRIWGDLSVSCLRDSNGGIEWFLAQIIDITGEVNQRQRYQLLAENASDVVVHGRDGKIVWISPSVEDVIGGSPDYWIGRSVKEVIPPDQEADFDAKLQALAEGRAIRHRTQLVALDGTRHWVRAHSKPFLAADGRSDGFTAALQVIDDEVAAEHELEVARRAKAQADERYRRSMDNSAIGMCLATPDGRFDEVNSALCEFFGYDEQTLKQMTWQDLTDPDFLEASAKITADMLAGRAESYRSTKAYIHADGHRIWGDTAGSCLREEDGTVEHFAAQIVDVTARVEADERNRILTQRLREKSNRISAELQSAAAYMASIMPSGLHGTVEVSSRFLPSAELGGDCFDYVWIDDDHLLVYLIDISGHGIEPALLSVSVHNMLRSGAFNVESLADPEKVLSELNRLFQMDQQNDHFFTLWLGVYQASTRTLRYSSAGANPVFAFNFVAGSAMGVTELPTTSVPVGMFDDTVFSSRTYAVPPGCQLLVFSDGANEIELPDGALLSMADFKTLATRVAGAPAWSLDDLITEIMALTTTSTFNDDCSLILLRFD